MYEDMMVMIEEGGEYYDGGANYLDYYYYYFEMFDCYYLLNLKVIVRIHHFDNHY